MKRFSSVIFDLDGTLLDTLEDLGDAVNRVLAARGFPTHPIASYRYFVGDGSAVLVERALPASARSSEIYREVLGAFLADYDQSWKVKTRMYDGVSEMLDGLTDARISMSVLSNKPHPFTVECVRELLSKWRFTSVLGLRPEVPRKPDPAGAFETAHLLGMSPERILYLGDSGTDMKTAVAAGMFPVGALWGFRTREELLANGAAAVIQHPKELLAFL